MGITLKRFYTTFILFIIIVGATGNDNNETSSSGRRESRATGRIVKLYSGARPEPILCTGEGFQKDPHNCAVFYRCMKSGNSKFTVFRFQCGPGTVFDPDTEVCNHPRRTRRPECGGYLPLNDVTTHINEIENNIYNEVPSPIDASKPIHSASIIKPSTVTTAKSTTPYDSTYFTTKSKITTPAIPYPWNTPINIFHTDNSVAKPITVTLKPTSLSHQENITPSVINNVPHLISRDNICKADGFIGDIDNCRKFYRCVANQRGGYTRYEFSCSETTIWDEDSQICNHAWAVTRRSCGRKPDAITSINTQFSNNYHKKNDNPKHTIGENISNNTIQEQLQIAYGSKATQTQTQISNGSVVQNQTQINYGDKINQNKDKIGTQNQTQLNDGSAISQSQTQINYGNKGVQTQLQIDHSKEASQSQIQISESATKETSTTTRHLENQETNNNESNDCTEAGFVGDINNCQTFYRCVDNGQGGYNKFEFTCGEGTAWDPRLKTCNHASAVKGCNLETPMESTTSSKSTSTYKTTPSSQPTTSTKNYEATPEVINLEEDEDGGYANQKPDQISTTSSTTISTIINDLEDGECTSNGFMGDENDCKIFYRCVEDGNGGFIKYEFKCGEGTVWDPKIKACNHAWAVEKCGGNQSPDINKIESTTENVITSVPVHIQSTTITHSTYETSTVHEDDTDDLPGYGPPNNVILSTTTSTKHPLFINQNDHICKSSGFIGDKNDCQKFYRCVDNGLGGFIHYEFTCGKGTLWDPKIGACNHAWAVDRCGETTTKPTTEENVSGTSESIKNTTTTISSTITSTTEFLSSDTSCTQSGFIGDSKDCKKFYRCVEDGMGSYTKYEFLCGEGTLWDQEIQSCNHASAVSKCSSFTKPSNDNEDISQNNPPLNDEIDNGYPSHVIADSDINKPSYSSTTESITEPNDSSSCVSGGFIGDKNDCKKFYRCVDDGKGSFTRYEYNCGEGTVWDQSIKACNHAWAVKCGTEENSTAQMPTGNNTVTSATPVSPPVTEGNTNIICANETNIVCTKEGFMGDPNNCKTFYRCVDNGKGGFTKYEYSCGEGTYWNQEIQSCDHITPNSKCGEKQNHFTTKAPEQNHDEYIEHTTITKDEAHQEKPSTSSDNCLSEGFYGDQNDCKKFYRCVDNGKGGYTKYHFNCGDGTVWDQEIQACNHGSDKCASSSSNPQQTTEGQAQDINNASISTTEKHDSSSNSNQVEQPGSDVCSSEGYHANEDDCTKFYQCVENGKGGYTKYDFTCSEGTAWDSSIKTCNYKEQVATCQGSVMHDEDDAQTTQKSSTTSQSSTATTTTTTDKERNTTQTTIAPEDNSSSLNTDTCSSEGYFGNTQDCKKFYRCVDNGNGGYTKYNFDCAEGTIWDKDVVTCNHPENVVNPSCNTTTETASSGTTTSGTAESSTQSQGQDATTKTPGNNNINCTKAGFYEDPNDCKKFYRCVDWDGDGNRFSVYHFECGEGTIWDPAIETCNHENSVYPPRDCSASQAEASLTEETTTTQKESTTESTTQSTTQSSTQSTTQPSTQHTTQSTTESTTQSTTESTTQSTTESTTQSTTESTTQSTTESTTQPTTQSSATTASVEQTTAASSESTSSTTTEQSEEVSTTGQSDESTTEQSGESTTEQSGEGTSEQSGQTTTEQSGESTTEQSVEGTTEKSEKTTTEKSGTSTTEPSEESTTEKSEEGTTEQSGENTTEQLAGTTEKIDQSTTEQSEEGTTENSGQESTEQSGENTTEEVANNTSANCPETDDDQYLLVCPSSFRRHPRYCNLFYQCDENEDTHELKIATFTCPNNTIYDESQTKCVEENKADEPCDGEIAYKRRVKRKNVISNYYNDPIVVTKDSQGCPNAGYYAFEKDSECSPGFLKCMPTKSNKLRGLVYQCPSGYVFWSVSRRCEPMHKVSDCKRSFINNWNRRWEIPIERRNVAYS